MFISCRYYVNPKPSTRNVLSAFVSGITKSLKMGINKGCRISVLFHTIVLQFLFKNKGSTYEHGTGRLYMLDDFDGQYFPKEWYRVYDKQGDGCEVEFPVRMVCQVKWEPTVYTCSRHASPFDKNCQASQSSSLF